MLINQTFLVCLVFLVISEAVIIWFGIILLWLGQLTGQVLLVALQAAYFFGAIFAASFASSQVCIFKYLNGFLLERTDNIDTNHNCISYFP